MNRITTTHNTVSKNFNPVCGIAVLLFHLRRTRKQHLDEILKQPKTPPPSKETSPRRINKLSRATTPTSETSWDRCSTILLDLSKIEETDDPDQYVKV